MPKIGSQTRTNRRFRQSLRSRGHFGLARDVNHHLRPGAWPLQQGDEMMSPSSFKIRLILLGALLILLSAPLAAKAEVRSFKAWKANQTEDARAALQRLQIDSSIENAASLEKSQRTSGSTRSDRRLEQARLNVEIAQELTTNDYFLLYLKTFRSKEALLEAARKLTPDEMGDLMIAYQKQLSTEPSDPSPTPGSSPASQRAVPSSP